MPQDYLPLHSNYLLTIPLLGALVIFSLAMALLTIAVLRRITKIAGLAKYHSMLGAITFATAVLYFPISLLCITLSQWQSGELFNHNLTIYSHDELVGGNLAVESSYTDQKTVDDYVEKGYGYKHQGNDSWGNPIYLDRMGNSHKGCSVSYGDKVDAQGKSMVRVISFDCP